MPNESQNPLPGSNLPEELRAQVLEAQSEVGSFLAGLEAEGNEERKQIFLSNLFHLCNDKLFQPGIITSRYYGNLKAGKLGDLTTTAEKILITEFIDELATKCKIPDSHEPSDKAKEAFASLIASTLDSSHFLADYQKKSKLNRLEWVSTGIAVVVAIITIAALCTPHGAAAALIAGLGFTAYQLLGATTGLFAGTKLWHWKRQNKLFDEELAPRFTTKFEYEFNRIGEGSTLKENLGNINGLLELMCLEELRPRNFLNRQWAGLTPDKTPPIKKGPDNHGHSK